MLPRNLVLAVLLLLSVLNGVSALQLVGNAAVRRNVHARRFSSAAMVDPSLVAADASTAIVSGSVYNPLELTHTLDTLPQDLWQTVIIAWVGLMGAYVTQVQPSPAASDPS